MSHKNAYLVLEDGSCFQGYSFGAEGTSEGEVIFNTSMSGYQEILTDPSYCGQIVAMTAPEIGNVGINSEDMESDRTWLSGFVVHNINDIPCNYRASGTLRNFLKSNSVVAISGIDTRALTKKLRQRGTMKAVITDRESNIELLQKKAQAVIPIEQKDLVGQVTAKKPYHWTEDLWDKGYHSISDKNQLSGRPKVAVIDFGVKRNILRYLIGAGFDVWVVPAYDYESFYAVNPDAVLLSNGPGDPLTVRKDAVQFIRNEAEKLPTLGICLGNQLLGLSFGYKTYRLKFGHHGANQPVFHTFKKSVRITSQNHNFAVDIAKDKNLFKIVETNLNDGTVETIMHCDLPVQGVQYHPEASPGPHDAMELFWDFRKMVGE
ncbi:MAG: carbamoyl-phosphate synthase small chain [bacterium]|nr:MAG: carbamoyl-phosphate synthase small chain [bacterium]